MASGEDEDGPELAPSEWRSRFFSPERASASDRRAFERDRDRLLYSDGFHRLSGIAQVARSGENYPYHTRLTHSQKVSQVGRRLAQYLNREYNEPPSHKVVIPEVVSAAALAHDLGHPPFGHAAENELDNMLRNNGADDGFEGNPQSFRIVNHVETNALYQDHPEERGKGINLTKRTLNAVLKYPWARGESIPDDILEDTEEKFGYYESEGSIFDWARDGVRDYYKTPEAKLMDWADDVTYAVHDLIDFYKVGVIPLGEIFQDTAERASFIETFESQSNDHVSDTFDPNRFLDDTIRTGIDEPEMKRRYEGTRKGESLVDLLQSELIEEFLRIPDTISYIPPEESEFDDGLGDIEIDQIKRSEVEFLKQITVSYVIKSPSLTSQQHGERRVVGTIFDAFLAASDSEYESRYSKVSDFNIEMVPHPFRTELKEANSRNDRSRIIGDAISSLTENQAIALYERISGLSPGSLTEQVI